MKIPEKLPWQSIGKTLGSGGQGDVELVTRKGDADGAKYALKALRNVGSSQAKDRFRREIDVVSKIEHPSIVRVIDQSSPEDDFQFYVMEYYEGARSLANVIFSSANPFHGDILKSLDIFEQIVQAISACEASSPQIIHRDINPKNILLLPDNSVRLIDFGICQIQNGQVITMVDEDVGTRNYTSPECEAGNGSQIGVHSDIYSASKVLWSVITSQRAFAREAPVFDARSMQQMFPNSLEVWHLAHIFENTIRQRPEDRFPGTSRLLFLTREIRRIVEQGFPPIEVVHSRCPSCGWNRLNNFPQGQHLFTSPNPEGVGYLVCEFCGFGFVRDYNILTKSLKRTQDLN